MEPEIMIIGAAIVDVLVRPAGESVFATGSYPAQDIGMSFGGDALNEAAVLAGLGKAVRLVTVLGSDMPGQMVSTFCRERKIELDASCVREGMTTGINVVLVRENGERSFLTNVNGSLRRLGIEDIEMPFPKSVKILCFASMFVSPRMGTEEMTRIFAQAKRQHITVCADMTKCKNHETTADIATALSYVDYLFANEEEAHLVTGAQKMEDAACEFMKAGASCVVIKCGARGCYVKSEDLSVMVPAQAGIECVDTTGAGDSFAAGFLYALSEGQDVLGCAQAGNRCGAAAVGKLGAAEWVNEIECEK